MCVSSVSILHPCHGLDCRTCSTSCCSDVSISAWNSSATGIHQTCWWIWTPNEGIREIDSRKPFSTTSLYSVTTRWRYSVNEIILGRIQGDLRTFIFKSKFPEGKHQNDNYGLLDFYQTYFFVKIATIGMADIRKWWKSYIGWVLKNPGIHLSYYFLLFFVKHDNLSLKMKVLKFLGFQPDYF